MESKAAIDFLHGFKDPYPPEFSARYEALECFSRGSFCETLLVRDRAGGRLLVAKCYEPGHPLFGTTEPGALRGLFHPGLPAFAGEIQGDSMRCILREYIPGQTLWELGHGGVFSPEQVRTAGIGLCEVLRYIHSRTPPVIHRDIKPQNVIRRENGSVALIDLGISRLYAEGARSDTQYCGTRDFAPPEQYGFLQTDRRSDIYSLGVLLAWMLTGKAAPVENPRTALERAIAKCTTFAPEGRFRDAAAAELALRRAHSVKARKNLILPAAALLFALALLIMGGLWFKSQSAAPYNDAAQTSEAGFTEPLIEQAVRLMLGKGDTDPISAAELASVTELYISAGTACPDNDSFHAAHEQWRTLARQERGPISSLHDLVLLPNLRTLCLAAQRVEDLSPLAALKGLERLELRMNGVSDLTPLAGLQSLRELGLNSNPVSDLTPLISCSALRCLDLCDVPTDYDGSVFLQFGDLDFLDISNRTDSYLYLGGKSIRELKLSNTALADLSPLRDVHGIERLEICNGPLSDLSGLADHPEITYLRLCNIQATDFTPLLELPSLQTVTVSAGADKLISPVAEQGGFTVNLE